MHKTPTAFFQFLSSFPVLFLTSPASFRCGDWWLATGSQNQFQLSSLQDHPGGLTPHIGMCCLLSWGFSQTETEIVPF